MNSSIELTPVFLIIFQCSTSLIVQSGISSKEESFLCSYYGIVLSQVRFRAFQIQADTHLRCPVTVTEGRGHRSIEDRKRFVRILGGPVNAAGRRRDPLGKQQTRDIPGNKRCQVANESLSRVLSLAYPVSSGTGVMLCSCQQDDCGGDICKAEANEPERIELRKTIEFLETGDPMREALSVEQLKSIYSRLAGRYDFQHSLVTARADHRARRILIDNSITEGLRVLDCGSGTGTMGIMAAKKLGSKGRVNLFDLSEAMLTMARKKVIKQGLQNRVTFQTGDMTHLPFPSNYFDVVLSTYSLCPLYDPERGALEMYRVTNQGGKIAIAHSAEPRSPVMKWAADRVEALVWRFPLLSMGCRPIRVLPTLKSEGGRVIFSKYIGVPLWPFFIFVVEKPAT
jgi:ubiquinone/menaquinone biosynthesis C-methylase UbiE